MKSILLIFLSCMLSLCATGQDDNPSHTYLGFGLGLEYGGMPGLNITYSPVEKASVYAGIGNMFTGVGFSLGGNYRFLSDKGPKKIVPYITGMYGTNAVIRIVDARPLSRIFKGVTAGGGIEFHPVAENPGHFSAAILIPFRGGKVYDYIDFLEKSYDVTYTSQLIPVLFSIGYSYHFELK